MASAFKICLVFAIMVAASSGLRQELMQQFLHPTAQQCQRSMLLRSLGLCNAYARGAGNGAEAEREAEAEAEAEVEREPVEQEAEHEPVEQEAEQEPAEQEVEHEAMEQEAEQEPAEAEHSYEGFIQREVGSTGRSLCGPTRFSCHTIKKCIPRVYVCNRIEDCPDGSDERYC